MKVNLKINDSPVSVEAGATILEAAELLDIRIPTLCHMKMDCLNFEHRSAPAASAWSKSRAARISLRPAAPR